MKTNQIKTVSIFLFLTFLQLNLPVLSSDSPPLYPNINQRIETKQEDIPNFKSPVCLLVGLNASELSYREISALAGFELFSVPYRSDIKLLVEQINPTQILIKHPSGFTGLYTTDGELIRGIQTVSGSEITTSPGAFPPSIIQPTEANPIYENVYYPSSLTGTIPHGGIGYVPQPKGRGVFRHLLKLASLTGLVPFQYPGYFMAYPTYNQEKLFPSLVFPNVPLAIGAASTIVDSKFDEAAYNEGRTQPRDYMFQPVIEGY